jgi:hypothetical protein
MGDMVNTRSNGDQRSPSRDVGSRPDTTSTLAPVTAILSTDKYPMPPDDNDPVPVLLNPAVYLGPDTGHGAIEQLRAAGSVLDFRVVLATILRELSAERVEAPENTRLVVDGGHVEPGVTIRGGGTVFVLDGAEVHAGAFIDVAAPYAVVLRGTTVQGGTFVCARDGDIVAEPGSLVGTGARVDGPLLLCPMAEVAGVGAYAKASLIGPRTQVGPGAQVKRSALASDVRLYHACFIADSLLAQKAAIGAFTVTGNVRLEGLYGPGAEVTVTVGGERIATGHRKFGAVIGHDTVIPAGCTILPGSLIGPHVAIAPPRQIGGTLPPHTHHR